MEYLKDERGNYLVSLNGSFEEIINEERQYVYEAPEHVQWFPEWMVVPEHEYFVYGVVITYGSISTTYNPYKNFSTSNLYGGATLNPDSINYYDLRKYVTVVEKFTKTSDGLYYVSTTHDGRNIYVESFIYDCIRSVHDDFLEPECKVPVVPAWKDCKLCYKVVPYIEIERYVVRPKYNDPEDYVEVRTYKDIYGKEQKVYLPKEGVKFEEILSAGQNLESAHSAVVVEKPFRIGVVFGTTSMPTTTYAAPAMGLPKSWVSNVIDWFATMEKMGVPGLYYLPLSDFVLVKTCFGNSRPPRAYLLPSAWSFILEFVASAPVAYITEYILNNIMSREVKND